MTPAQRERLRVALERETGVGWSVSTPGESISAYCAGYWLDRSERKVEGERTVRCVLTVTRTGARLQMIEHATGRGWPERLAAEVGRVIREAT